jgi:predicted methyltransferase
MRKTPCYLLALALAGCGSSPPPEPVAQQAPPALEPEPAVAPEPPAPEPTAEELQKAREQALLEADRQKLEQEHAAELERWTPELRSEAQALAEKSYPNARAALKSVLAGKHRKPAHVERDAQRRPMQTLEFFGFKPTQTVLEYGPGEGWYTELLAPALAKRGKLIVTTSDPNGPVSERSTLYGRRLKLFLEKSPEIYGKVEAITIDPKAPKLGLEGSVDLALLIRSMHGMHNNKLLDAWLAEFHRALKPNGVLGVVQHRAAPDADLDQSSKQGYLPEAWLITKIEASGFKLAAKSELNANPKDTRQHPDGVWSLPPTLRSGDAEKYMAIGESDRMTLRFVKAPRR